MNEIPEPILAKPSRKAAFLRLGLIVLLAIGVFALFKYSPIGELLSEERTGALLEQLGFAAYPLWILLYAVLIGVWVPGTPLTAFGAAVFGPVVAIPLNYLGAVLGAVVGFVVARAIGGTAVDELFAPRFPLYRRYEETLSKRGFEAILYMRLVPTPYTLVSYLAGLSPSLTLGRYTLATAIGIIPGSFAFTYLLGTLVDVGRSGDWAALLTWQTVVAAGGYLVVASLPALVSYGRKKWGWFASVATDDLAPVTTAPDATSSDAVTPPQGS